MSSNPLFLAEIARAGRKYAIEALGTFAASRRLVSVIHQISWRTCQSGLPWWWVASTSPRSSESCVWSAKSSRGLLRASPFSRSDRRADNASR